MARSSRTAQSAAVSAPPSPGEAPFEEIGVAIDAERRRGRGAQTNASGRFEAQARVAFDDGWQSLEDLPPFKTVVGIDTARKVITHNDSARYRV